MSLISADTIKVIAETCGIVKIQDESAQCIIQEVEYKMRLIIQESRKYMKNSKHDVLTVDNVNFALRSLNFDEIFGHSGRKKQNLRFLGVPGYSNDVYFVEDKVLNLEDIVAEKLPLCPRDCSIDFHWLAIDGVQPRIPENPVIDNKIDLKRKLGDEAKPEPTVIQIGENKSITQSMEIAKPEEHHNISSHVPSDQIHVIGERRHELSKDHLLYLEKQEETMLAMSRLIPKQYYERFRKPVINIVRRDDPRKDHAAIQEFCSQEGISFLPFLLFPDKTLPIDQKEEIFFAALESLQRDPLRQVLPYLIKFLSDCFPQSLEFSTIMLISLNAAIAALFLNPYLNIQPYVHQLIPLLATCVIRPKLGNSSRMENHWMLRDFSSKILVSLVSKFGTTENQIEHRLAKTFVTSLQKEENSFNAYYGAIRSLSLMGHHYTQFVVISSLPTLHSRAMKAIHSKSHPLLEIENFLGLMLEISGNYFREMIHHFKINRNISILTLKSKTEESKIEITKSKTGKKIQNSKSKLERLKKKTKENITFNSVDTPVIWKNNFLLKKRPKFQSSKDTYNHYIVARQLFGEGLVPYFPEFVSCSNLFI